ncbi:histidine decarboxylase [Eurytemora carolleeae]|uniref:histidine decarboxylase n=1 Tax=Eurytemora carolleeae TaxID=1294199 RepID=UPI000C77366B|nr:histidine decarboxylase [Eurytemora carolleeae]|eukprot:XP_023333251.1 histidine decarboxylase-like [Eurytemora affinis]
MDAAEYRVRGKEMVDYIADYLENIRDRRVFPDVKPGYLRELVPDHPPQEGESFEDIFKDVERVIMPGVTHWQSPYMHAYFPALNSYPSLLGDMLADGINCLGFTWASSPACTELESLVMDWLGMMIGLPAEFLHRTPGSLGGGVIQTTASESTFVSLLAGRTEAIQKYQKMFPDIEDAEINSRLVGYCSDQAHSSVEKAGLIGLVKLRYIESDENLSLRGDKLREAIKKDRENGLVPFYLCATLGTTGACAFDNLQELGPICQVRYRNYRIEFADSIAFNPSKWLLVHFDCTAMWVKNSRSLHRTFNVEPLYLQHENTGLAIDYMVSYIFIYIIIIIIVLVINNPFGSRENVRMAQKFEALVRSDSRFEIPAARHMGMVVFRLKGENSMTEKLLKKLNSSGKMHAVPCNLKGQYVIRFTLTSPKTTVQDITRDWCIIRSTASDVLESYGIISSRKKVPLKEIKEKNESFGTSLLLANIGPNSPMSPKIVDGSFAALFDNNEVVIDFSRKLKSMQKDIHFNCRSMLRAVPEDMGYYPQQPRSISIWGPRIPPAIATRRRVRGMLMSGKQYSLDSRIDLAQAVTDEGEEGIEAEEEISNNIKQKSGAGRGRSLSVVVNSAIDNDVGNALRKAKQQAIPEYEDDEVVCEEDDIATTTILQPHQTQTIRDMIKQLDINLEEGTDQMDQVKEAFIEFYKLFDDFGIIDKSSFNNINRWNSKLGETKL